MNLNELTTTQLEQLQREIEVELRERDGEEDEESDSTIYYELPWPPSVNHYWIERAVPSGKGYYRIMKSVGPKGKKFREDVEEIVGDVEPMRGNSVSVHIDAYPPDRRKRDIDNIFKATLDAMEHAGVYENDNQIKYLSATKHDKVQGGKMKIYLKEEDDDGAS